jgi:hypothetical protein
MVGNYANLELFCLFVSLEPPPHPETILANAAHPVTVIQEFLTRLA